MTRWNLSTAQPCLRRGLREKSRARCAVCWPIAGPRVEVPEALRMGAHEAPHTASLSWRLSRGYDHMQSCNNPVTVQSHALSFSSGFLGPIGTNVRLLPDCHGLVLKLLTARSITSSVRLPGHFGAANALHAWRHAAIELASAPARC